MRTWPRLGQIFAKMTVRLELYRGNLLDLDVDAIVNAANSSLMGGGGVDGVIHRAAGSELRAACRPLAPCPPGRVRVKDGFGLAPRLIFHTVGPVWQGGDAGEPDVLAACYRNCVLEAARRGLASLAFPAISTGIYGYPLEPAADIAASTCLDAGTGTGLVIHLTAFDDPAEAALGAARLRYGTTAS